MSGEVVGWAMKQTTGSPAAKLVLAKLADNSNEQGLCWPSIELIVEHTELGQSTVYKHLAALEAMGLISPIDIAVRGNILKGYQLNVPGANSEIPPGRKPKTGIPSGGKVSPRDGKAVPPAGTHIEEPPFEPSMNRHSSAPGGAEVSGNVASLGKGSLERWPEFRSTVAKTWPGGFPADNETACKTEFERRTRAHHPELVIACAAQHGRAKTEQNTQRSKGAGAIMMKRPSNWLKDGDWEGYIPIAEEARRQEARMATALGSVRRALGDDLFEFLRRKDVHELTLAMLDGVALEPPAHFTITTSYQRTILEKYDSALERLLGKRMTFTMVAGRKVG